LADFHIEPFLEANKEVKSLPIKGIAKHLCGAATDLAIEAMRKADNLEGLAIATCCHNACSLQSYVNL